MIVLSRLSAKSQVTVPKAVRDALDLEPGDTVEYEIGEEEVVLRRAGPFDHAFHRALSETMDEWTTPEDEEAFSDL